MIFRNKRRKARRPNNLTVETGTHFENTFTKYWEKGVIKMVNGFHLAPEEKENARKSIFLWVKAHYYMALGKPAIPVSIEEAKEACRGLQKLETETGEKRHHDLLKLVKAAKQEVKEKMASGKPLQFSNKNGLAFQTAVFVNIRDSIGLENFETFKTNAKQLMTLAERAARNLVRQKNAEN